MCAFFGLILKIDKLSASNYLSFQIIIISINIDMVNKI